MKTVFILGAGASADAGAPVMKNFLERGRTLRRQGRLDDCAKSIDDVLRAADQDLLPLYAKSHLELENIEDLFSAIEMGQLIGRFGNRSAEEIAGLRHSIVTFICRILEESLQFPLEESALRPTKTYGMFAKIIAKALEHAPHQKISAITFNYDFALENALWYHQILSDYCLGASDIDSRGQFSRSVPVLKLHGSLNWTREAESKRVVAISPAPPQLLLGKILPGTTKKSMPIEIGSGFARRGHSGPSLESLPYIIPPTWNKMVESLQLEHVWKKAADEIGSAENIVVVGFSFPQTDRFFRFLFALGAMTATRIRNFAVIDMDPNVNARFRELTGRVSAQVFRPFQSDFRSALGDIESILSN